MKKINLITTKGSEFTGIKFYAKNLDSDLKLNYINSELKEIPKYEITILGKKIGGWKSQDFLLRYYHSSGINHSTFHWVVTDQTDITTIHDLFPLTMEELKVPESIRNIHIKRLKKSNKNGIIIVMANEIKNQVLHFIPDADIRVITSKVFTPIQYYDIKSKTNIINWINNPYPNDHKLHLLTMGEILGNQGNRKQITHIYDYVKDNKNIELYHIGKITDNKYLNYSPNIHHLTNLPENLKLSYLKFADKFVYKTLGEGQGLPTMEAMKLNIQPIINDIPIHRELLGDKPYYFHNKDEFLEMIYKPKKDGLVEQITQYDNWISKYKKVYEEVSDKISSNR